MITSQLRSLNIECKPDSYNWNAIRDAFYAMNKDERFSKKIECGQNLRGMSFTGSFKEIHGKILARLTPIEITKTSKGKVDSVERHTNLIKERWMTFC